MTDFNAKEKDATQRMESALTVLNTHFRKIRTGRAHSSLIEDIKADYYGNPTPLMQMANINTPDARTINIVPYDKTQIPTIAKAIEDSDLGMTPNTSEEAIIINIPPLNEETRNNFCKQARTEAEQSKVAIRNVRRDVLHKVKEDAESEDMEKQQIQQVDKLTESYIQKVDQLLQQKEKELLEF